MRITVPLLLLSAYLSVYSGAAGAALGGAPTDFGVKDSGRQVRVLAADNSRSNFRVNESTLSSGTVVREYVAAASGTVFAVSWTGPIMPDLQEVLGKHVATLNAETFKKPRAGNSQVSISRPDIVIQSGGHMRAFEGRAWVASEFPSGFTADDIQ
ncbi:MAG: DUF2844 domain-containing protein [Pseudomonadota bacterium]